MSIGKRRYMKKQSKSPQIRFQNFEDEWLDSTIGRHISLLNGRAYKQEELLDEGKYRVLRVGNFNTNSKWYYSNLELEDNKYVNKGDLLYLWATNFGPEIWTEEKAIYHYHIWKLEFDKTDINQDYLYIWLESDKNKIQQNTNGSTMVHITKNMMEERRISLPSQDEQSAIGSLFRTLDDLLDSYKDNLANYQSLKVTMLSKVFPKAGQTVPEIRLDGFEGEWNKSKLKDVAHRVQGNDGRMDLPTLTISASGGWMNQIDRFSANIAGKEQKNYTLLKKGELSYNHGNSKLAKYGVVFELQAYEEALVPKVYHSFRVNQLADAKFIEIMFSTKIPDRELGKLVSSGARMDGLLNISFDDFMNIAIIIPTIEEQQAIGAYFSNLDNLINSYQEKISQLETLKKKLLQDMFI